MVLIVEEQVGICLQQIHRQSKRVCRKQNTFSRLNSVNEQGTLDGNHNVYIPVTQIYSHTDFIF